MPPSPTPPTIINDLPPETIERVVKLAYPVMSAGGRQGRERTRFLLAVAFVCRDWTLLAQEALWLDVRLDSRSIAAFVAAGPGRFPVRRLDLEAYQANIPSVKSLLRDVRGVCELSLTGGYIDTEWICGDNFKHLESLSLRDTTCTMSSFKFNPPFRLVTLQLTYRCDPPSFQLLGALTYQLSIKSLTLSMDHFNPHQVIDHLTLLAPQLDTLKVMFTRNYPHAADAFLRLCTRLKHLTVDSREVESPRRLVVPLVSWTLLQADPDEVDEIIDALNSGWVALSKLEWLIVRSLSPSEIRRSSRWSQLVQKCKEKNIGLMIGNMDGHLF